MEDILQYFENISINDRSLLLIGSLAFFLLLETGIPLFQFNYSKFKHAFLNIFFTITTLIINVFGAFLILMAIDFNVKNNTGLLNLFSMPLWLNGLLGLLLLDLIGAWFIHWIEHRFKWLWKFHLIHHTDPYIDVTSGLRHHPVESIFRLLFTALAVFLSGASFGIVMLYQSLSAFFANLTHANIRTPPGFDKLLATIFVTPHFHKTHHHYLQPLTDSNYGNIFSIWDHLFRTANSVKSMDELTYGIDTHMAPKENSNIKNLLLIPFQKYRPAIGSKFND